MSVNKLQQGTATSLQTSGASAALATLTAVAAATNNLANQTNLDRFAEFVLNLAAFATFPAVGTEIRLYLVPAYDGTNFADVDTTAGASVLQPDHYVDSFWTEKAAGTQRLTVSGVRLRPYLYKAYLLNMTGQTIAAGWTLDAYGEVSQTV